MKPYETHTTKPALALLSDQSRLAGKSGSRSKEKNTSGSGDNRLLILIVDDSDLQVSHIKELLAAQPFDYLVAHNGVEAIAAARRFQPHLILMDIEMPLMNGIETAQLLRRNIATTDIPIIMVTGHCQLDDMESAFAGGCNDYVTKPVHQVELLEKIQSLTGHGADGSDGADA